VFDVMVDAPFYKRAAIMEKLEKDFADFPQIQFVETQEVISEVEADYWYYHWKKLQGYEGMMYRDSNATYGFSANCGNKENRWNCLLKRKEMIDLVATITGFKQMKDVDGNLKDTLGAFELQTAEGASFSAGSGLTDEQRAKYWRVGEERMLGIKCRILYEMKSDGGVPLKPIIDLVDTQI
jgi:ATP-dependent DNA ligase